MSWYAAIANGGGAAISASEHYRKQTERNRCRIATANGVQLLTVPVTLPPSAQGGKCPIRQVRISDHGNWRHLHWQALQAAYGMSPFFDYYADDLRPFFEKRWDYLFDYNMEITATMLRLLGINAEVPHPCPRQPVVRRPWRQRYTLLPDLPAPPRLLTRDVNPRPSVQRRTGECTETHRP